MSFTFLNELPSPAQIQERYPLSEKLQELKKQRDAEISNVIKGLDNRFLVIIGPCSATTKILYAIMSAVSLPFGKCQRQADHHPTCVYKQTTYHR